ncbi:hypothetical protein [Azospirillum argentinense]
MCAQAPGLAVGPGSDRRRLRFRSAAPTPTLPRFAGEGALREAAAVPSTS